MSYSRLHLDYLLLKVLSIVSEGEFAPDEDLYNENHNRSPCPCNEYSVAVLSKHSLFEDLSAELL